jgi:hypothetical protein
MSSIEQDSLGAPAHNSPITDYRYVLAGSDFLKPQVLHGWYPAVLHLHPYLGSTLAGREFQPFHIQPHA